MNANTNLVRGFYVMSGMVVHDGPFDTLEEAGAHLARMCGPWASPELLAQYLAYYNGAVLDLARDTAGNVVDGHLACEYYSDDNQD